jgi:hypothetical protein
MQNAPARESLVFRSVQLLLGAVTAFGAFVLAGFLAIFLSRADEHPPFYLLPVFWLLGSIVVFFAVTSFRLLSGRGAAPGDGLLSPIGYRVSGGLWSVYGATVVWDMGPIEPLRAALLGLGFGGIVVACFAVAHRRARSAEPRTARGELVETAATAPSVNL